MPPLASPKDVLSALRVRVVHVRSQYEVSDLLSGRFLHLGDGVHVDVLGERHGRGRGGRT